MAAEYDDSLLEDFVDFFEWIYAVDIESRDRVYTYVRRYWDDEDTSEQELIYSATDQYTEALGDLKNSESIRALLHKHFRREFRAAERRDEGDEETDRDNILLMLREAITDENPDAIDHLPALGASSSAKQDFGSRVSSSIQRAVQQPVASPGPSGYGGASGVPQNTDDMQERLLEEQRQAQLASFLANMSAMRHATMMNTIQHIKY
jgi:hypothetical protein